MPAFSHAQSAPLQETPQATPAAEMPQNPNGTAGQVPSSAAALSPNGTEPKVLLKKMPVSHPERILIAYYKQANITPDILLWASLSPFLESASDGDTPHIVQRERNRLEEVYANYNVEQPLSIHTTINTNNYSTLREMLVVDEFNPQTFFSYSLYDEHVAIVPNEIEKFHEIPFSTAAMEELLSATRGSPIQVEMLLKPKHADTTTPFMFADKPYKLMLADVAEIRFWAGRLENDKLLWTYRADWYTPQINNDLMQLKAGSAAH